MEEFYTDAGIRWFDAQSGSPNWSNPKEKRFACLIQETEQNALCLLFNAGAEAVDFRLPPLSPGTQWHLAVNTFAETPHDLFAADEEPLLLCPQNFLLEPRSSAILLARRPQPSGGKDSK
jgi:glycogen operon protein